MDVVHSDTPSRSECHCVTGMQMYKVQQVCTYFISSPLNQLFRPSAGPYCPGAISKPCFPALCTHPPARASPPDIAAYSLTRASSSGRKCRIRPWMGHAKASPRAMGSSASYSPQELCDRTEVECERHIEEDVEHTANTVPLDLLGQLLKHIDLSCSCLTLLKPLHHLRSPHTSFSARRALATTFVLIEFG